MRCLAYIRTALWCGIVVLIGLGGAVADATAAPAATDAQILHFLNRVSFGPAPGDIDAVRRVGLAAYLEQQLHPEHLRVPADLSQRLESLPTLGLSISAAMQAYAPPEGAKKTENIEKNKALLQRQHRVAQELTEAKILRAILSPAQLQEVMVDFWFNHFNVFAQKAQDKILISSYERDAIRPYALGKFRDLLQATAHHPAMLVYLDNWLNTDPNSPGARGRKVGVNENYAREIMELHTLGINGGYTQQDVTTLAHILTGWGLSQGPTPADKVAFFFDPRRHDSGNKILLNTPIRGGGQAEFEQVIDMLARHPSTAHHIAYKLAQAFVADDPPARLVDQLAATFLSSDGDIAVVLRTLFHSAEFWDASVINKKFKPPFRYVISTLRANGAVPPDNTKMLQLVLKDMGQHLYFCQTPNGYANTKDQWLNSDALLKRIDFTKKLSGFLNNQSVETILDSYGRAWNPNTLQTIQATQDAQQKLVLLMSSPDFVYY